MNTMKTAASTEEAQAAAHLHDGYARPDNRGLAHNDAGAMIQQDTPAKARSRVDVHGQHLGQAALQGERHHLAPLVPERMCEALNLNCVVTLEVEEGARVAQARGILNAGRARGQRAILLKYLTFG